MTNLVVVIDSGVGGISVLHEIFKQKLNIDLLYIADNLYLPYGNKSEQFIKNRCAKLITFAANKNACAIVIACNTATAYGAEYVRSLYPHIPILGTEPAIKPAVNLSNNGNIGLLATAATAKSMRLTNLVTRYAPNSRVIIQACPGLAEQIERGELASIKTKLLLQKYVNPLLDNECDVIILGCTHYPFIKPLLKQIIPPHIKVIDSGYAIAKYLYDTLNKRFTNLTTTDNTQTVTFMNTSPLNNLTHVLPIFWLHEFNHASLLNL